MEYEGLHETKRGLVQLVTFHSLVPFLDYIGKAHRQTALSPLVKHVHQDTMEISYLERGSQVYEVREREYELRSGDFFVTYPYEEHGTGLHPEERSDLYWIGLDLSSDNGAYFGFERDTESIRERLRALPRILKCTGRYGHYFERILSLAFGYDRSWHLRLHAYVADLLFAILDLAGETARQQTPSEKIGRAINYIDGHITGRITVTDLCDRVGLSRCRFQTLFREQVGMPPGDYIIKQKIAFAKEMLHDSTMSVTDIAYELSFSSSQHFSATFRNFAGMTPSEYARSSHSQTSAPPVLMTTHGWEPLSR